MKWLAVLIAGLFLHVGQVAHAAHRHHHGHYPASWLRVAACVRYRESRGEWGINTGNGYFGAYQFLLSTWAAHKPRSFPAYPNQATPRQQTFVVWRTYLADGRSWREWNYECG